MVLDTLARIVKVQLPAYLKRLPLPESVGGFIRLTGRRGERDPLPAPARPVLPEILGFGSRRSLQAPLAVSAASQNGEPRTLNCFSKRMARQEVWVPCGARELSE